MTQITPAIYGLLAEFDSAEQVVAAARRAREAGYTRLDAFTPFPVHGLDEAIGIPRTAVALITLLAGILGGAGGFFMCWYACVISYPINVGGRPLNSWPAFIPLTFELTVLCAGLAAAISMIVLNGLPRLNHPLFNVPNFAFVNRDRFFLCIQADDPRFALDSAGRFLAGLKPLSVQEVPLGEPMATGQTG